MEAINLRRTYDIGRSYILTSFETFYSEIVRQKNNVTSGGYLPFSSSVDLVPGDLNSDSVEGARVILNKLASIIEKQTISIQQQGGDFATQYFKEAAFIMVALADEIFLSLDWKGRKYWEDNLLESRFFGTHDAGDQFFQRLDNFLNLRDPAKRDLGELYLLALGLGFLGKFRGVNDQGKLHQYLRQLYIFVHHRDLKLFNEPERLFPESYAHTLEGKNFNKRKPFYEEWGRFKVMGVILGLLLVSHIAWRLSLKDLTDLASQIRHESLL